MFCPNCGQQQISKNTKYCFYCGLSLSEVAEIISKANLASQNLVQVGDATSDSPRKLIIKQSLMIMSTGAVLWLVTTLITILLLWTGLQFNSSLVFIVMGIVLIVSFFGGLLLMIYAFLFESNNPVNKTIKPDVVLTKQNLVKKQINEKVLPLSKPTSVSEAKSLESKNKEKDMVQPPSVTEDTTRIIQKPIKR